MTRLPKLLIPFLFLCLQAHGIATLKLNEIFSTESNPGQGTLSYVQGEKSETITFGAETGHYGLGLVFRGAALPEPYSKDFKKSEILQVALGTMRTKVQSQIPQFATATIISGGPLTARTTFNLAVPGSSPKSTKSVAFLLFTSPKTPSEQSDEEKLKGTYFAQSGTLIVTPVGKVKTIGVRAQGKNVNFKMQAMEVQFKAVLVTPFNSQENQLQGKIEFPVYWPSGNEAQRMIAKMATDSLGGMAPVPAPEGGLSVHNRDIAGSTKKDTPQK